MLALYDSRNAKPLTGIEGLSGRLHLRIDLPKAVPIVIELFQGGIRKIFVVDDKRSVALCPVLEHLTGEYSVAIQDHEPLPGGAEQRLKFDKSPTVFADREIDHVYIPIFMQLVGQASLKNIAGQKFNWHVWIEVANASDAYTRQAAVSRTRRNVNTVHRFITLTHLSLSRPQHSRRSILERLLCSMCILAIAAGT